MTVTGGRTVYELRGISCLPLELMEPTRKGIAVTRSFGAPVTAWQPMREAIASYATRAAEKMRRYRAAAENIFVFMHTDTFNNDPFYSNGASARFAETNQRHLGSGRACRALGRTALALRLPLLEVRRDDYGTDARNYPATGSLGRAGPGSQGAGMEGNGQAQRYLRARYRPHPRCRTEERRLEAQGRAPITPLDHPMG